MELTNIIQKIKTFLSEEKPVEVTPEVKLEDEVPEVKLEQIVTKDGVILEISKLEVDGDIVVVNETEAVPAEGEFILEDGTKIVAVEGKITEVVAPEAPIEAPIEEEAKEEEEEEEEKVAMSTEDLEAKIAKLEETNLEIFKILDQLTQSLSAEDLKEEIKEEQLSKIEPVEAKQNTEVIKSKLDLIFENMYKK